MNFRVAHGLSGMMVFGWLAWAGSVPAGDGIAAVQCFSGVLAGEINSDVYDRVSDQGYPTAYAEANANGVRTTSRFHVAGIDGATVRIELDMQRQVAAGARPSVGFGTAPGTNRVDIVVHATNDVLMDVAWSIAYSGDRFGMPNLQLWRDWVYLRELCDNSQALAEGAWSTTLPGQADPQRVFLPVAGNISASTGYAADAADRMQGWVELSFAFTSSAPPVQGIAWSANGLSLTLGDASLGQTNTIQISSDLMTTNWTVLTHVVAGGLGSNVTVNLPTEGQRGFYRCRVNP